MSQKHLYHWVPKNMQGTTLYPLNQLKITMPEVYAEHVKKYVGREKLLERKIPILNCFWNDVLHFTAVHPDKVNAALNEAGIETKSWACYKIPTDKILGENAVAFLYTKPFSAEDKAVYEVFSPDHMDQYAQIPPETIDYYKECKAAGKKPLVYHLVPHVLYKGSISTEYLEVIN
jgi:hypothetical protein